MGKKITDYTNTRNTFDAADEFDVSAFLNPTYESQKTTWTIFKANLSTDGFASSGDNISIFANDSGYLTSIPTHTGEVTGGTALVVDKTAITGQSLVTGISGDFVLISDTSNGGDLRRVDVVDFLGGADGDGIYDGSGSLSGTTTVTQASNDLIFSTTGDSNALVIDGTDGNIGLGVAAPGFSLEIRNHTSGGGTSLGLFNATSTKNALLRMGNDGNKNLDIRVSGSAFSVWGSGQPRANHIEVQPKETGTNMYLNTYESHLLFGNQQAATVLENRGMINGNNGRWGIGDFNSSTLPQEILHVDGNLRVDGDILVDGTKVIDAQGAAVADATDAASAITQLNLVIARLEAHGLIA